MKKLFIAQLITASIACNLAAYNNDAQPHVYQPTEDDYRFFLGADVLYWQANQQGMAYGQIANFFAAIPASPLADQSFLGSELNVNFKFTPGARIFLGFRPYEDYWKVNFIWTHLNSKANGASDNPNAVSGPVVIPAGQYGVPQPQSNNGTNATAAWTAHFNTFDVDLHKDFFTSKTVNCAAHMGLKSLWLNQTCDVVSLNTWNTDVDPRFINAEAAMIQKMWGVGPMVGFSSEWTIYEGLHFFGQASLALMWSHVNSSDIGTILVETPAVTVNKNAAFYTTLPELTALIGAEYTHDFEDTCKLSVRLGWDFQTIFNANYLGATYTPFGNFNLSGLTAGLGLDF